MTAFFWALSMAIIACYAFFVTLGAWDPVDVAGLSAIVAVLAGLWLVRAWVLSHRDPHTSRDVRLIRQRERRGF